jgi:hypothetical protein
VIVIFIASLPSRTNNKEPEYAWNSEDLTSQGTPETSEIPTFNWELPRVSGHHSAHLKSSFDRQPSDVSAELAFALFLKETEY